MRFLGFPWQGVTGHWVGSGGSRTGRVCFVRLDGEGDHEEPEDEDEEGDEGSDGGDGVDGPWGTSDRRVFGFAALRVCIA